MGLIAKGSCPTGFGQNMTEYYKQMALAGVKFHVSNGIRHEFDLEATLNKMTDQEVLRYVSQIDVP